MEVDSPKISDLVLHERHVEHPRAAGLVRFNAAHVVTRGARRQGREQRAQRDFELGPRSRRPSPHCPFGVTLEEDIMKIFKCRKKYSRLLKKIIEKYLLCDKKYLLQEKQRKNILVLCFLQEGIKLDAIATSPVFR